jgi:hypothetical protein
MEVSADVLPEPMDVPEPLVLPELAVPLPLVEPPAPMLVLLPEPVEPEAVEPVEPLALDPVEPPVAPGVPVVPIGVPCELCWPAPVGALVDPEVGGVPCAMAVPITATAAAPASRPLMDVDAVMKTNSLLGLWTELDCASCFHHKDQAWGMRQLLTLAAVRMRLRPPQRCARWVGGGTS